MDWTHLPAHRLYHAFIQKSLSSHDLTHAFYTRIERVDDKVCAYHLLMRDSALEAADEADREMACDRVRPLLGIPIALKDNLCTRQGTTTCSSKILEHYVSPYDATVVVRLRQAGAVVLGKTNMDEFAMGSSTENSAFRPTRNPWDLSRIPGGSSGGSAAAVAADMAVAALGSDTGGSIRQPASCCGVVGLKPTYGRVSRYGLVAFASSLDQIGPMTHDVKDAALLLGVLAGYDPKDSTSADLPVSDYVSALTGNIEGLRIGLPREYFIEGIEPEVSASIEAAVATLRTRGAIVTDISLPHTEYAIAVYYILATAEASANLARYDGVRYGLRAMSAGSDLTAMYQNSRSQGFGPEVKRRILLGTYVLSSGYYDAYYKKAQKVRTLIREDFDRAFQSVDVILTPTAPTVPFRLGEKTADPLQMYLSDIFTISVNLAGIPAISVPCGFSSEGLPIGLQMMARPFDEAGLLNAAYTYEQAVGFHEKRPSL